MKSQVLVCCHKECTVPTSEVYLPIHVGKSLSEKNLGIQGDNEGENISLKNSSYCELTGLYWAWKNLKDVDVIGLCHYRRYFDFHHQCNQLYPYTKFKTADFDSVDLTIPDDVFSHLDNSTVIVPRKMHYNVSLYADYCICHVADDFRIMEDAVKEKCGDDYVKAFKKLMYKNNRLIHYNMFIMRWELFDEYCSWLFDILGEVEKRTDISHYTPVQKRIYGYMAERLFNVFISARHLHTISKPIIYFDDRKYRFTSKLKYIIRILGWNLSLRLSNL